MTSNQATSAPLLEIFVPHPPSKFDRERQAFFRLLPQLIETQMGQYAAIHDEHVIDSGSDRLEVALRVLKKIGNVDFFAGFVDQQPETISLSGVRRNLSIQFQS